MLTSIDHLFSASDPADVPKLSEAEEREHILAAQTGARRSWDLLMRAYRPIMRKTLSDRWSLAEINGTITREDLQSTILTAFVQVVHDFNPEGQAKRLAAKLKGALAEEIAVLLEDSGEVRVPSRTRKRFFHILNLAEGDLGAAVDLCRTGNVEMAPLTFLDLADILLGAPVDLTELDSAPSPTSGFATTEQRLLGEYALSHLEGEEKLVTRYAYGFIERDPLPDAEIGHRIGADKRHVAKARAKALTTMRSALIPA